MAAWLGSYGPAAFGGDDLPQPSAVIMQYTGDVYKRQVNGVYDEITGILKGAGKTIVEFSDIMSNPTYALDAAAAIGQQDSLRIFGQAGQILFHTTLALSLIHISPSWTWLTPFIGRNGKRRNPLWTS